MQTPPPPPSGLASGRARARGRAVAVDRTIDADARAASGGMPNDPCRPPCRPPCRHLNRVGDRRSNDEICTDCGLVVGHLSAHIQARTFGQTQQYGPAMGEFESLGGCIPHTSPKLYRTQRNAARGMGGAARISERMRALRPTLEELCHRLRSPPLFVRGAQNMLLDVLRHPRINASKRDELLCIVCICLASRRLRVPYTFRELSSVCATADRKDICRTFKSYERRVGKNPHGASATLAPVRYGDMLPRYCSLLGVNFKQQRVVRATMQQLAKSHLLRAMNPLSQIAAAIRVSCPDVSSDEIAAVCGISVQTIDRAVVIADDYAHSTKADTVTKLM